MSRTLRPELTSGDGSKPVMTNGTAYLMILSAVQQQPGLVHGKLHEDGAHCAIGSFFEVNERTTITWAMVDEVAAVNDSVPHLTRSQRKAHVARWLRWKLSQLGMTLPGPKPKRKPKA